MHEHGKNIASCSTDPGSASCQKGLAMNDALMVALRWLAMVLMLY
ncbi:Filamentous hemagglutinin family outer membrane protein [Yersinia intermedia ATCC 29909]|nr:Filamentous hemagglutinin family outer membrane protein [Yersinia intermedia ATCC 29909]